MRRALANRRTWVLVALVEFAAILALNRFISDLVGGFSAAQARVLLGAELAALTYANRHVQQRLSTA